MKSYQELLQDVMANGEHHDDRTGVGTSSVFGRQWRHDMRDGFPLLTTKKVALRWVFEEMRFFLSGSTDRRDLSDEGVTIWNEWDSEVATHPDDLGPIYGRQFRSFGSYSEDIIKVESRVPSESSVNYEPPFRLVDNKEWRVVEEKVGIDSGGNLYDTVEVGSGYRYQARRSHHVSGHVSDPYQRTFLGIGYMGEGDNGCKHRKHLYGIWSNMMFRCYCKKSSSYKSYGDNGVTVCSAWHNFSVFCRQVKALGGWCRKKEDYEGFQLDKDHFKSKCYSAETCLWLPTWLNKAYCGNIPFVATDPLGVEHYHFAPRVFADHNELRPASVARCVKEERLSHKGWKFRRCEDRGYGFTTPVDQISKLMDDIRTNPNSRRMVVSAWNPPDIPRMALPPCHVLWQLKVHQDNSMSLLMNQRSADIFLGVPFNIASYALLLSMLCEVTGRTPRDLIVSFGDLHLYDNHVTQATTQLAREPFPLPAVTFTDDFPTDGTPLENLLAIRWEHVQLTGYRHHAKIAADVAV